MEGAAGAEKFGVLRVSRGKTVILEKNRGFPTQLSVPPLDFGEKWLKGGGHLVGIVLIAGVNRGNLLSLSIDCVFT